MQEYVEEDKHCNALPKELFGDLTERLKSGVLRAAVDLRPDNGNTLLRGNLTGLRRFVYGGNDYDVLTLTVAEPASRKRYSTVAQAQTRDVSRPCPLEAVARIQIFGYGDPNKFATVYSRV